MRRDLIAGLSVAGLLLPEAVAYAGIAGLPPQRALLAAIAGALAYAAIGRSRFAIVAPTSSSAAILAAALGALSAPAELKFTLATVAVALVGLLFLAAGLGRLGGFAGFISRPVLRGFTFGLAVTIILRQMPLIAGIQADPSNIFRLAWDLVTTLPRWHLPSVAIGLAALIALLLVRRWMRVPGAFTVLAAGIAASILLDLPGRGVATIGNINLMPGLPTLTPIPIDVVSHLAEMVLPLVLILFAESWGTMRTLALRHGDALSANRELAALGAANLAAAAMQGMPVGAGFSAGSASEAARAETRLTGVIAALVIAVLVLSASHLIAHLPQPVLAAVVIAALAHALDPGPIRRLWRLDRDQYVAIGAALGVLALGVLNGMLFAIFLSLAALVQRMAQPHVVRLGRLDGGHNFVDVARHPEAETPRGLAIWRPAEPLFFANAEHVLAIVADKQREEPEAKLIVLSLEESFDLDSTALDALLEFEALMEQRGVKVRLARVRDHVRDLMKAAGADRLVERSSYSVDDAVDAALADLERA